VANPPPAQIMINDQPAPLKGAVRVKQNDVLTVYSPGGGFGAAQGRGCA
jgi:hypothetical protein